MERELFKEMYDEIRLNGEQKDRIWRELESGGSKRKIWMGKRFPTPVIAAICACVILIVGMPALAANFQVVERLAQAFASLNGQKMEAVTKEQQDLYAQYGQPQDIKVQIDADTFSVDAVIHDGYAIYISYSVKLGNKAGEPGEKLPLKEFIRVRDDIVNRIRMNVAGVKEDGGGIIYVYPDQIGEGGGLTGTILLQMGKKVEEGTRIQVLKYTKEELEEGWVTDDDKPRGKIVDEIVLGEPVKRQEIPVDTTHMKLPEELTIEGLEISPMSLIIRGKDNRYGRYWCSFDVEVELKDGTRISSKTAGTSTNTIKYDEKGYTVSCAYERNIVFDTPVSVDQVAKLNIDSISFSKTINGWIPVGE